MSRTREAGAIFGTHGLADAATTALATATVGHRAEGNPIVRSLLEAGLGWAIGSMLLVSGLAAVAWPVAADAAGAPRWIGYAVAAVGAIVALGNLAVVAAGWSA